MSKESLTSEPYQPSPIAAANQTLSYFLSHHLPKEYIMDIVHSCHTTHTGNRFVLTGQTPSSLSYAIQEQPDQEAFAAFFLGILDKFTNGEDSPYEILPVKIIEISDSQKREMVTLVVKNPVGGLKRALQMEIAYTSGRIFRHSPPPRVNSVSYFFDYGDQESPF